MSPPTVWKVAGRPTACQVNACYLDTLKKKLDNYWGLGVDLIWYTIPDTDWV